MNNYYYSTTYTRFSNTKYNTFSESGRSLVEMLGVLAIMGILTIGGIAGFNYAMDRSKANDILNGVNQRTIALSPQLMLGTRIADNALDSQFPNHIANMPVSLEADETGFDIIITRVPAGICDQVLNNGLRTASEILLNDTPVWSQNTKFDHTCAPENNDIIFAFNASLDGTRESTTTTPTGNECTTTCSDSGATCVNGYCQCPNGLVWNPGNNAGYGNCRELTKGDCKNNSNCPGGQYCKIISSGYICRVPDTGICTALEAGFKKIYKGKMFLLSDTSMQWWAARSWCLAHNKTLVNLSDINCTANSNYTEMDCSDWNSLSVAFGNTAWWTSNSPDRCSSIQVSTYSQTASYMGSGMHGNSYRALCR